MNLVSFTYLSQEYVTWLYFIIMSSTRPRVNLHTLVTWMLRNSLREHSTKRALNRLAKLVSVRLQTKWFWLRILLLSRIFNVFLISLVSRYEDMIHLQIVIFTVDASDFSTSKTWVENVTKRRLKKKTKINDNG